MKHILFLSLFIFTSLFSFSQKRDTFNLLQGVKQKKKDAVKEILAHPQSKLDSVYYIKYGTTTNKCTGFCFHEAVIDSIRMLRTNKNMPSSSPVKTDSTQMTSDQWDMLINSVEISSFFGTPEKIGNTETPGVVIEWIEINYIGNIHRVTFDSTGPDEYEGIKNLEKLLKRLSGF